MGIFRDFMGFMGFHEIFWDVLGFFSPEKCTKFFTPKEHQAPY